MNPWVGKQDCSGTHPHDVKMIKDTEQEKSPVRLKGMGNGLCVMLDPVASVETLQQEIVTLLADRKDQIKNTRVILDVGTAEGHDAIVKQLAIFLKKQFGVGSVSRLRRRQPDKRPAEAGKGMRQREMDWYKHQTDVLVLTGRVRSGQKVNARKHLVILGDVNPGGEVMAGGDILVMGSLLGTAIAGQPDNEENIVLALDFRPTQIQIGSFVAAGLPASPGKVVEFAHVESGQIVVEDYLKANPFGRIPWPQVR